MARVLIGLLISIAAATALAEGDADRGETLIATCNACHGADGNSPAGAFPDLAGQNPKYIVKQLVDIKSGERDSPQMTGLLNNLDRQDFEDIAAFYAMQEPDRGAAREDLVELGEKIYRVGIPRKNIAACTACHLPQGEGNNPAAFPALAGQWPEYLEKQLKAFRTGERTNDGDGRMMRSIAMDMSDEEIEAVSSYLHGLY
ncbi:MAG: c-type cytochrome [Pseudomonadales bacterium]